MEKNNKFCIALGAHSSYSKQVATDQILQKNLFQKALQENKPNLQKGCNPNSQVTRIAIFAPSTTLIQRLIKVSVSKFHENAKKNYFCKDESKISEAWNIFRVGMKTFAIYSSG